MSTPAASTGRLRRGWNYYRRYTKRRTGIHAAAAAALTGFGLLATVHRGFIAVAIAAYLLPPVYLYLAGDDLGGRDTEPENDADTAARRRTVSDADADADGLDTDTDGIDADGIDADADADGTDTDSDSDG